MTKYMPPSIRTVGLKKWLENTKPEHDGYGYDTFIKELPKQNLTALARIFKVSRMTMMKWIDVYWQERDK